MLTNNLKYLAQLILGLSLAINLGWNSFAQANESAPAAATPPADGKSGEKLPAWFEHSSRLTELQAKIKMKEGSIQKLILEKKGLDGNPPRLKEITDLMVSENKELNKYIEDYEKTRTLLLYRYPEMGAPSKRLYERKETSTLEEREKILSMDVVLTQAMNKARYQYGEETKPTVIEEKTQREPTYYVPGSIEDPRPIVIEK